MLRKQNPIIVTGGTGFIGSHLCERLAALGEKVISLDNYFTGSKRNHIQGVEYITCHTKNIAEFVSETPSIVYHLGEYPRVEKSFDEPDVVFDLNITGTAAVLEFCRRRRVKIVYAGSSSEFSDEGKSLSPYTWTKATNIELIKNYGLWYGLSYAITYFYNVYGPRERTGAYGTVIGIFREQHQGGEPLTIRSPGTQRRNFTHVLDIVEGLVAVGEKGEGDGFGIGSDRSYSILEVAKLFGGEIKTLPPHPANRMGCVVKSEKTRALGWKTEHSLEDYIMECVE